MTREEAEGQGAGMKYLSLFSGQEAAHLAWAPLGWECAAVAEVDPSACALLRHRLPHVPNLGDVTKITDDMVRSLGRIDVVIGGSPCQDLSVAGKRAGLAGARSSLFHEQLRIFHAARHLCGARWLVWENVPGAFSSNAGRDFAVVVGALAGCDLAIHKDGWGNEGLALGENGLVEWSVLDAQWFGVAQRRRRVFAVLDTGDWASRPPILLEPESLRGDSAPRREAGEGIAGTLAPGAHPGGFNGQDAYAGQLIPALARCVTAGEGKRQDHETCTIIPAVAFDCKASGLAGFGVGEIASTMRSMGHADSHQNGGGHLAVQMGMQVRRLTPIECERLQGTPDKWTMVPNAAGKPMADGPRYKMLGNSFAVPVIRWIGRKIEVAHSFAHLQQEAA